MWATKMIVDQIVSQIKAKTSKEFLDVLRKNKKSKNR